MTGSFHTHFDMNPPLSHFLRASVFSGKSSSGRCRTSTSTESSAWTSGRSRSSSADTMSYRAQCKNNFKLWLYQKKISMLLGQRVHRFSQFITGGLIRNLILTLTASIMQFSYVTDHVHSLKGGKSEPKPKCNLKIPHYSIII